MSCVLPDSGSPRVVAGLAHVAGESGAGHGGHVPGRRVIRRHLSGDLKAPVGSLLVIERGQLAGREPSPEAPAELEDDPVRDALHRPALEGIRALQAPRAILPEAAQLVEAHDYGPPKGRGRLAAPGRRPLSAWAARPPRRSARRTGPFPGLGRRA